MRVGVSLDEAPFSFSGFRLFSVWDYALLTYLDVVVL